jgi:hypothetical protein
MRNRVAIVVCSISLLCAASTSPPCIAAEKVKVDAAESASAIEVLKKELDANGFQPKRLADLKVIRTPLTKADAATAHDLIWNAYKTQMSKAFAAELKSNSLKDGDKVMPLYLKTFGEKPKTGRSLWISLHGGGGAPKATNDSQWENQKRLYTLKEGIYAVPRAPTNTWNLWHEPHIDRLFDHLIEALIVKEDVNPDQVYVIGYSAGGDGVYQLAPRMADRWAAAGMMAGHPNDASPLNLRNVAFSLQVGALDNLYNRNKVAKEWGEKLDKLRADDPGGYEHSIKLHEGKDHWMGGQDAAALPWMAEHSRNPVPDRVVWKQGPTTRDRMYWLAVPHDDAKKDAEVIAVRKDQNVDLPVAKGLGKLLIRFDSRTADLDKPVTITRQGKTLFEGMLPRTIETLVQTLDGYGDPKLMFEAEVAVEPPA